MTTHARNTPIPSCGNRAPTHTQRAAQREWMQIIPTQRTPKKIQATQKKEALNNSIAESTRPPMGCSARRKKPPIVVLLAASSNAAMRPVAGCGRRKRVVQSFLKGFTLIEVLVVLLIVGIVLAGVSISIESLNGRDTQLALGRLRWTLEAGAERAQLRGQAIAFELLPDGYRFSVLDANGKWTALEDPPTFTERLLPAPLLWDSLHTDEDPDGRTRRIIFRTAEAPRFLLQLTAERLRATLQGRPTGAVELHIEAAP